jgi:hypothetical protein
MHRVDSDKERITFDQLAGMLVAANAGKSKSTQTKHSSIIKELRR